MQCKYSVSEFYMLLKLGIWKTGTVNFWGQADILPVWDTFLFSDNSNGLSNHYDASSLIKKHLDIGLYLLDLFYISKDATSGQNIYQLILAVCRNDMTHMEALYNIQISNNIPVDDFFQTLSKDDIILNNFLPKRKQVFAYRRIVRTSLSSNMPIGSRFIVHR